MPPGQQHYTGNEGREYHERKRGIPPQAFEWVTRARAEKLGPHVRSSDLVFEYGVGSGWNLAALPCREKVGYDVTDFLAPDLEKLGIRFVQKTAGLPDSFADCAICHHTLEHVISPPEVLGELKRLLQPKGKLLLFVPFEKERRYRRYHPSEPNHHLYSWNCQTLGNLVSSEGFAVTECAITQFGYDRFAAKLALRFRLGESAFRAIRGLAHLLRPGEEVRLLAHKAQISGKA